MKRQNQVEIITPRLVPDLKIFCAIIIGAIAGAGVVGFSIWIAELVH